MYVDYEYYSSEYLLGRSPAVPDTAFAYWEKEARLIVDKATYGRLKSNASLIDENVKDCVCAILELLYQSDKLSGGGDTPGILASYSNDGESGTFDLSQSDYTPDGKMWKIRSLLGLYLSGTGLLYAGGIYYER